MMMEFEDIEKKLKGGFEKMRKELSKMRRDSGMGTKVNKGDAEELEYNMNQIENISVEFSNILECLAEQCIR